jgi:hypothetical protein
VSADQIKQAKTGHEIMYRKLSKPLDPRPVKVFLLPGCTARKELNSSLAEYVTFLTSVIPAEDMSKYKKMLESETFLPAGKPEESEMSLMSGLHSLEIMKNGVLTVESSVLNRIASYK